MNGLIKYLFKFYSSKTRWTNDDSFIWKKDVTFDVWDIFLVEKSKMDIDGMFSGKIKKTIDSWQEIELFFKQIRLT